MLLNFVRFALLAQLCCREEQVSAPEKQLPTCNSTSHAECYQKICWDSVNIHDKLLVHNGTGSIYNASGI